MTTVFERITPDQPQTHALIIGVGAYRHLLGGSDRLLDDPMGLKQLSSPPVSARAMTDWLLKHFHNPELPLGSVELLLSPAAAYTSPSGEQLAIEAAVMHQIESAFDRWFKRCDTHAKNVAIFYFCGHGVMKENLVLLAEDFGESPSRLFKNAIDLEMTHLGMARCQARTQFFFTDSCRQVPSQILELRDVNAPALIDPLLRRQSSREAPIFYASSPDSRAYGLADQTTRFTAALLQSLDGVGSKKQLGHWVVTTNSLQMGITSLMEQLNQKPGVPKQQWKLGGEASGTRILHVLEAPPTVPVRIKITPPAAAAAAELQLLQNGEVQYRRLPEAGDWEFTAQVGVYDVQVRVQSEQFHPVAEEIWIDTPTTEEEITLEVNPE